MFEELEDCLQDLTGLQTELKGEVGIGLQSSLETGIVLLFSQSSWQTPR